MKPTAEKAATTFRLTYSIRSDIRAPAPRIWALLTDAPGFPAWNSTVSKVGGEIGLGQTLAIEVPMAPGRTFRPKVTKWVPNEEMVWSDGFAPMFRGVRTFKLTAKPDGITEFAMTETFSGIMLPLIKGSLPDFGPAFATYVADLERAATAGA